MEKVLGPLHKQEYKHNWMRWSHSTNIYYLNMKRIITHMQISHLSPVVISTVSTWKKVPCIQNFESPTVNDAWHTVTARHPVCRLDSWITWKEKYGMEREYKTGVLTNLGEIWKINREHQSRGRKDEGENFFREKNLQQQALRRGTWSFLENQN